MKGAKKARRIEQRTVFLIFRDGQVALRRRPDKGLLAGLWEYPNELAPAQDMPAHWGITPESVHSGGTGRHIFSHVEWYMNSRIILAQTEQLPNGWVWADRQELERQYAVPSAFQSFEDEVRRQMGYFE